MLFLFCGGGDTKATLSLETKSGYILVRVVVVLVTGVKQSQFLVLRLGLEFVNK